MNPKHIRVWPIGDYPTEAMDLVNENADVVVTISAMDPEDGGEPNVLIEDKNVRVLVEDNEISKVTVERELKRLSKAMNVTWLYIDSDEKLIEMLEKLKSGERRVL